MVWVSLLTNLKFQLLNNEPKVHHFTEMKMSHIKTLELFSCKQGLPMTKDQTSKEPCSC